MLFLRKILRLDWKLPKDTCIWETYIIQYFANLASSQDLLQKNSSNRSSGVPGVGEGALHFLCSRILNKDLLEFLPLSHDHDKFSLIVSITEATERNWTVHVQIKLIGHGSIKIRCLYNTLIILLTRNTCILLDLSWTVLENVFRTACDL